MDAEKPLGILGGMGPEATELLYRRIIELTPATCDQDHIPAIVLSDVTMPDRTAAILADDTEPVLSRLIADARLLESCGCGCLAIPCNTSHYFADAIQSKVSIPLINMVRLTVGRLSSGSRHKAAVLATEGTVRTGVYARELEAAGLECWVPEASIQAQVTSVIYDVVKAGAPIRGNELDDVRRAVQASGCDCAVLGCTELSVWNRACPLPDFYIDSLEVLAEECVSFFGRVPVRDDHANERN